PPVCPADAKLRQAHVLGPLVERGGQQEPPGDLLDRSLPDAGRAQKGIVPLVRNRVPGLVRQLGGIVYPPQRDVRVEEEPQVPNSSSTSGIGASKSRAIHALPRQ